MGKYTRLTSIAVGGLLVDYGLLAYIVRNDEIVDVSAHDPIFKSAAYQKFNPNRNVATQDEVIKRIPLSALKPEVLEQKERIADKFAGGVFGGTGMYFPLDCVFEFEMLNDDGFWIFTGGWGEEGRRMC